ncbi:MAG: DUF2203 domain-containing protein [Myxococcales bacterium]
MARRVHTVTEVETLIPSLERIFTQILQLRVGLRGIEQKLERAGVTIDVDDDADEDLASARAAQAQAMEPPDIRHARAVFRGFYEALSDGLEQIRQLGGEVKDLDLGLVDFPGRRGGEDILLCWRLGEKRIEYWHPLDGGFANRRPLDGGIPGSPPSRLD